MVKEVFSYNEILQHFEEHEENKEVIWKFKCITAHEGSLKTSDLSCNSSICNVMVEWENGEITSELLAIIAANNPVTCAIYIREHNLLDKPG